MSENPTRNLNLPEEEVLDVEDIQGDILPGFNKDHLTLLFFRIKDVTSTRSWLRELARHVATTREVLDDRRFRRAITARRGSEPDGLIATWINLGLSAAALQKLVPQEPEFADDAFRIGLMERSGILGDPALGSGEPGDPRLWKVGGPGKEADVAVLVASDDPAAMRRQVQGILSSVTNSLGKPVLELIYKQECHDLSGDLKGHEHFGFRDGISLPGVRGRASRDSNDFVTPRLLDPASVEALRFSKPGQALLWPGQFVFGYRKQDPNDPVNPLPDLGTTIPREFPDWARNGSLLVIRRLRQDVPAFREGVRGITQQLARTRLPLPESEVAAKLVGRWPSGAPVIRTEKSDLVELARDPLANNDFGFQGSSPQWRLRSGEPLPAFPSATDDTEAIRCPRGAHIRKMNPRDQGTDIGPASVTLTRIPMRRGLPFGKPYDLSLKSGKDTLRGDRGLMFISYQTSIVDQFEFILSDWANHSDKPNNSPEGHDPILGRPVGGGQAVFEFSDGTPVRCLLDPRWVIPTGGGYFFVPSISALNTVLATEPRN